MGNGGKEGHPFWSRARGRFRGNQALPLPLPLPWPVWALSVQSLVSRLRSTGWLSWCLMSSHCNCRILAPAHKPSAPLPRECWLHSPAHPRHSCVRPPAGAGEGAAAGGSFRHCSHVSHDIPGTVVWPGQCPPQEWAPTTWCQICCVSTTRHLPPWALGSPSDGQLSVSQWAAADLWMDSSSQ